MESDAIGVIALVLVPSLILLVFAIAARAIGGRSVTPRVVQYLPPRGGSVLNDALLTGNDKAAVPAVLIDLAVRRKIRILAAQDKKSPVAIEIEPDARFTPDEIAVLDALLGRDGADSRVRRFSKDKRMLAGKVRTVMRESINRLKQAGLILRERVSWPARTIRVFCVIGALFAVLLVFALSDDPAAVILSLVSIVIFVAAMIVVPSSWRTYTPQSYPVREHLAGLNGYITLAEADRLRFLQSPEGALRTPSGLTASGAELGLPAASGSPNATFALDRLVLNERLLPYAIIFGHSKEWMAELKVNYEEAQSSGLDVVDVTLEVAFDLILLADALGSLVELTGSVGDILDAGGNVFDGIGGLFDAFSA